LDCEKKMRNKIKLLLCSILFISSSFVANAQTSKRNSGIENGGNAPAPAKPSVKAGADKSKSDNTMAQAVNYATGAIEVGIGGVMIKSGMAPCPSLAGCNWPVIGMGTMMVMMGMSNIAQGTEHGKSADTADGTSFQTNGGVDFPGGGADKNNPYLKAALNDPNFKQVGPTLAKLEKMGIYDPKAGTVKLNDKTYKVSDFASADAMAAAGFPKGMIDGAMQANADAEKKAIAKMNKIGASTTENGYAEGGSGGADASGGDSSGSSGSGGGGSALASAGGAGKGSLGRDPAAFNGMSKNFNGNPIGVAADDIFNMMTRRYKFKGNQDSFFNASDLSLQN
jgi:hypothetical protein